MPSLPKASLSRCAESGEEIPSRQRSVSVYYKAIVIITHARNIRYASETQAMNHREVYCPAITLFAGRLLVENPLVFSPADSPCPPSEILVNESGRSTSFVDWLIYSLGVVDRVYNKPKW
jgi:hypothetical protein